MTKAIIDVNLETDDDDDDIVDSTTPVRERWGVNLYMQFDADSPLDAVEMFLQQTLNYAMRGFCYSVRDRHNDDEICFVDDGVTYTPAEYEKWLDAQRAERLAEAMRDGD